MGAEGATRAPLPTLMLMYEVKSSDEQDEEEGGYQYPLHSCDVSSEMAPPICNVRSVVSRRPWTAPLQSALVVSRGT